MTEHIIDRDEFNWYAVPKEPAMLRQGMRVWEDGVCEHIVARIGNESFILISLVDGNRYYPPVESLGCMAVQMNEDESVRWTPVEDKEGR